MAISSKADNNADSGAAERLARRYPRPRLGRSASLAALALVIGLSLSWIVWTGLRQANPSVAGRLETFSLSSAATAEFSITMERTDPATVMVCRVIAQSDDFERVGELDVTVPPGHELRVTVNDTIRTFRPATSVSLDSCRPG